MPELPEVETMVRGIRDCVVGGTITAVTLPKCSRKPISIIPGLKNIQKRVIGTTIDSVDRRAKRVKLTLSSGDLFVIEPRMTGLMLLRDAPTQDHLRFQWTLALKNESHDLWFWDRRGLGTIRLYSAEEYAEQLGPKRLGPDALEMTSKLWKTQLQKTSRPLKVAMLDQKLVAGIGNLYASEILYRAKLSPQKPANQVSAAECIRLSKSTLFILKKAIQYEGSTLSDGTYRNALNRDGSYQNEHRVYMKQDTLCPRCQSSEIQRIVQAQRSTFFCPTCQPE